MCIAYQVVSVEHDCMKLMLFFLVFAEWQWVQLKFGIHDSCLWICPQLILLFSNYFATMITTYALDFFYNFLFYILYSGIFRCTRSTLKPILSSLFFFFSINSTDERNTLGYEVFKFLYQYSQSKLYVSQSTVSQCAFPKIYINNCNTYKYFSMACKVCLFHFLYSIQGIQARRI